MRKLFFIFLLFTAIFNFSGFAQEKLSLNTPILVNEFGKVNSEMLELNLEIYLQQLRGNPTSSGQVLIYSEEKRLLGSRYRFAATLKAYLQKPSRISSERLAVEQCGLGKEFKVEFYLVPVGVKKKNCAEEFFSIKENRFI